ncbi:hypothetical protein B0H15DRAFT_857952, partial [Mycena belliarum]
MQRPLISYDDITLPYQPAPASAPTPARGPSYAASSQSKKRKWSSQKPRQNYNQNQNQNQKAPAASVGAEVEHGDEGGEEDNDGDADSRYLTAEEIWDDSALIDAWNAATEEYEAMNGPDKGWKTAPVHKSPLWYNVPPDKPPPQKKQRTGTPPAEAGPSVPAGDDADSQPLDFATFVPSYDASLALPAAPDHGDFGASASFGAMPPPGAGVASQDEAFSRALGAMYWGGYWTAVYHCHRAAVQRPAGEADAEGGAPRDAAVEDAQAGDSDEDDDEDDEEAFVPTQR